MQIAIIGAGFTPEEADRLRRSLATFKKIGTIHTFRERFLAGHGGERLSRRLRRALLQPDRGLRRIRLPREPRRELRAAGLRLGLAEVPPSGGLRLRAAELAADGLLRAGADRARRTGARGRGAPGLHQRQLLGQRARARRPRRAGAAARLPPDQGDARGARPTGSPPPAATATATSRRSGAGPARRGGCSRRWSRPTPSPASASPGARRSGRRGRSRRRRRCRCSPASRETAEERGRPAADDARRGDRRRLHRAAPDAPGAPDGAAPAAGSSAMRHAPSRQGREDRPKHAGQ